MAEDLTEADLAEGERLVARLRLTGAMPASDPRRKAVLLDVARWWSRSGFAVVSAARVGVIKT